MKFLPPSRAAVFANLRLLAADWRVCDAQGRYFIASQLASVLLLATCSLGAIAAIVVDDLAAYLGLLAVCGICLVHNADTRSVLKRRFLVRYELL